MWIGYALPSANRITGIDPSTRFVGTPKVPISPSAATIPTAVVNSARSIPTTSRNAHSEMSTMTTQAHGVSRARSACVTPKM